MNDSLCGCYVIFHTIFPKTNYFIPFIVGFNYVSAESVHDLDLLYCQVVIAKVVKITSKQGLTCFWCWQHDVVGICAWARVHENLYARCFPHGRALEDTCCLLDNTTP